jgi:hypothetical protein
MAWTGTEGSHVFRSFLGDVMGNVAPLDLDSDGFKAALYGNSGTPTPNVTSALSAYNAGSSQWVTANEVSQAVQFPAGGVALSGIVLNSTGTNNVVFWDANDVASGSAATLANVYGTLVYDTTSSTVTNQGVCFNYLGGSNSVTNGTFTVVWNANGIWRATV